MTPTSANLALIALEHSLVICLGAGFSMASPTELPSGATLAQLIRSELEQTLGPALPPCEADDLTAIADCVATLDNGVELLRQTCLDVAAFTTASPNYAHKGLATMLLEGLVTVLSWNWDNCIEQCGHGEQIVAIVTDADRREVRVPALLKLHGCATRPSSMLITTDDLTRPQPWVETEMATRLTDSVVVFVGIRDVAAYTRHQILSMKQVAGRVNNISIASPGVVEAWTGSVWSQVADELPADHRIAMSAEEFVDALGASIALTLLAKIRRSAGDSAALIEGFGKVDALVRGCSSLEFWQLSRKSRVGVPAGRSCFTSNNGRRALLALGMQLGASSPANVRGAAVTIGENRAIQLLVSNEDCPSTNFSREARSRLVASRNGGFSGEITFLCSGALGPLPNADLSNVIDEIRSDDILAGAHSEEPVLVGATTILEVQ